LEITTDIISDNNKVINISLKEEDYNSKVNKTLKEYGKKIKMDGFRTGKVPFSIVKKRYGREVLLEEINSLLQENLKKYIEKEKLRLLVDPLLKEDSLSSIDLDTPGDLTFSYEIATSPDFNIDYSIKRTFNWYRILVDDALIDQHIESFRVKHGKLVDSDVITEDGFVEAELQELTEENLILIGGISNKLTFPVNSLKDDNQKKRFESAKVEDTMHVNILELFDRNEEQIAKEILNTSKEQLDKSTKQFRLTIHKLLKLEKSPIDIELYDKVLGKGIARDHDSFKSTYKKRLESHYDQITQQKLYFEVLHELVHEIEMSLPDEYLKRWLTKNTQKELSEIDIEKYYQDYAHSLRERLIKEKLLKDQEIKIEDDDITDYMDHYINDNFGYLYEQGEIPKEEMAQYRQNLMRDQQYINNALETLIMRKQLEFFHSTYEMQRKEVSLDEYMALDKKDREAHSVSE